MPNTLNRNRRPVRTTARRQPSYDRSTRQYFHDLSMALDELAAEDAEMSFDDLEDPAALDELADENAMSFDDLEDPATMSFDDLEDPAALDELADENAMSFDDLEDPAATAASFDDLEDPAAMDELAGDTEATMSFDDLEDPEATMSFDDLEDPEAAMGFDENVSMDDIETADALASTDLGEEPTMQELQEDNLATSLALAVSQGRLSQRVAQKWMRLGRKQYKVVKLALEAVKDLPVRAPVISKRVPLVNKRASLQERIDRQINSNRDNFSGGRIY